jgi:hypothetical protein
MNPHSYAHHIFDKGAKNTRWRKGSLFNKCCWETWLSICKKLKLDSCLSPYTNINSKWIKDLNIRPKTLKLVQERSGTTLEVIGIGKDFLDKTPEAQQLRERMEKWDFTKLRSFCTTKEMVSKLKRPTTEWEKIFARYTSDKGLITRIYKELKKLNSPKTNEPIKKWATELNRTFSKEEIQMAKTHMKKCSPSLAIKEMQIKTTLRFYFTLVRIAIIKNTTNNRCWRGCGEKGTLIHCWWECKLVQPLWKKIGGFLKI